MFSIVVFFFCLMFAYLLVYFFCRLIVFFFKQKTAYEMRISDWSSDVSSSDLAVLDDSCDDLDKPWIVVLGGHRTGAELFEQDEGILQIGRASCRARVCQYV